MTATLHLQNGNPAWNEKTAWVVSAKTLKDGRIKLVVEIRAEQNQDKEREG